MTGLLCTHESCCGYSGRQSAALRNAEALSDRTRPHIEEFDMPEAIATERADTAVRLGATYRYSHIYEPYEQDPSIFGRVCYWFPKRVGLPMCWKYTMSDPGGWRHGVHDDGTLTFHHPASVCLLAHEHRYWIPLIPAALLRDELPVPDERPRLGVPPGRRDWRGDVTGLRELLARHRNANGHEDHMADGDVAWLACTCGWRETYEMPEDDMRLVDARWEAHLVDVLTAADAQAVYDRAHGVRPHDPVGSCLQDPCPWHPAVETRLTPRPWYPATLVTEIPLTTLVPSENGMPALMRLDAVALVEAIEADRTEREAT